MAFNISVSANGTYNTFDNGNTHKITGGYNIIKIAGTLDGATITPQVDFYDAAFVPLVRDDGLTVTAITIEGAYALKPLKVGMQLRFNVTGATTPNFTIKGL